MLSNSTKEKQRFKDLDGRVAIVTGGSSGIGAAVALKFTRERAKVVIAARRKDKSEAVVRQIEAPGSEGPFHSMPGSPPARAGRSSCPW
jgi:NAD(P)-dependent dehydrogenase (short-subunit alcohol dehydrogenase family)